MVNNKVKVTQKVHKYIKMYNNWKFCNIQNIFIMHFIHKLLKENNAYIFIILIFYI